MKIKKEKQKKKIGRPKKTRAKDVYRAMVHIPAPKLSNEEGIEGEVLEDGKKDRFGRPTVITQTVRAAIVQAAAWGCSDVEIATFAQISPRTLAYLWKREPDLKEFVDDLKNAPLFEARKTLIEAIKHDPYYALQLLERKLPHEFGKRVRHTVDVPEQLTTEEWAELDELIDANF